MLANDADVSPTLAFFVEGMVNSRAARAVSRAVRALDLGAVIRTDPATQRLDVEPSTSDAEDIVEMLSSSGFDATLTANTVGSTVEWVDTRPPDDLGLATMESAFALADFHPQRLGAQTDRKSQGTGVESAHFNQALATALSPFDR